MKLNKNAYKKMSLIFTLFHFNGFLYKIISTRVRTPVALLCSLLGKYPWERYEPPYPPSYGLNSTSTVLSRRMALALNNLQRVDMPLNKETKPNQYKIIHRIAFKQFFPWFISWQFSQPLNGGCNLNLNFNFSFNFN